MAAIRQGKIYSRKRTNLEDVIPLEVPFSIQIDICSACNLKCNFCFHSDLEAIKRAGVSFGYMSYELFVHIIDDMKRHWAGKKVKKLRLFKVGEPLLNPHVCEMVRYAKEANVAECIEITTNGTLLTHDLSQGLIDAGLDILNISINGINEKQYENVCQYSIKFFDFYKEIEYFFVNRGGCQIFLKYSDIGYSEAEKNEIYQLFDKVCDEIFVETISSTLWQDTNVEEKIAYTNMGTYGQELKPKQVCPFLFTTMVINDRGIAHLCCADWKCEYILGDLKTDSIADVWNGRRLREFQCTHLRMKKDSIKLCRKCESLSANSIDDIDQYAEQILKRLED